MVESLKTKDFILKVYILSHLTINFLFTVNSLVEHVINHVLYSCLSGSLPSHMVESLKTEDFILKVYDKSEYLLK